MHEWTAVEDLNPGDYIDLENDEFADPFGFGRYDLDNQESRDALNADHDYEADHMYFECEYAIVEKVVEENEEVTALYSDQVNVGFPHGHKIRRYTPSDEDEQQWAQVVPVTE